jgi:hypothetical protein
VAKLGEFEAADALVLEAFRGTDGMLTAAAGSTNAAERGGWEQMWREVLDEQARRRKVRRQLTYL